MPDLVTAVDSVNYFIYTKKYIKKVTRKSDFFVVKNIFLQLQLLIQSFQLVDIAGNQTQSLIPEIGAVGIEPERFEQLIIIGNCGFAQHIQIFVRKVLDAAFLTDLIQRIDQTIGKGIGIDIERQKEEMPDLHPDIGAVFVDIDIASQTVAHFLKPYLAEAVFGKLAVLSFIMTAGFEEVKGNLPNGGINHIVDFTGNQAEFGSVVFQTAQQRLESYHFAENRGDFLRGHPAVFVQIAVFGAQLMMAAMAKFMRQSQNIILFAGKFSSR